MSLAVHPGVIRKLPHSFATGVRMAFDVRGSAWGFTPLVNRGYPVGPVTYFVEGVVPIRFEQDATGATNIRRLWAALLDWVLIDAPIAQPDRL